MTDAKLSQRSFGPCPLPAKLTFLFCFWEEKNFLRVVFEGFWFSWDSLSTKALRRFFSTLFKWGRFEAPWIGLFLARLDTTTAYSTHVWWCNSLEHTLYASLHIITTSLPHRLIFSPVYPLVPKCLMKFYIYYSVCSLSLCGLLKVTSIHTKYAVQNNSHRREFLRGGRMKMTLNQIMAWTPHYICVYAP